MMNNPYFHSSSSECSSFPSSLQYRFPSLEKSSQQHCSFISCSADYSAPYKARCVTVTKDKPASAMSVTVPSDVQFVPLNMADNRPSPSALAQFQERSRLISLHLSEIVEELTARTEKYGEEESFPELETYAEQHIEVGSDFRKCGLCGRLVATAPRWHFESAHYEEFLRWLEGRARVEARRRLVNHRRRLRAA